MTIPRPLFSMLALVGLCLAGCSGGSSSPAQSAAVTPPVGSAVSASLSSQAARAGCIRSVLPARYRADQAHSGALTAHNYSQAADIQAALEYDQLKAGSRMVYVDRSGRTIDRVASCVAMQFASAHLANRFFLSYRDTRDHAPSIVRKVRGVRTVGGVTGTTAYFERAQSFRGYHISSTNVVEVAGRSGNELYIASVAAKSPSVDLARTLLESMVSSS
jgi:hypothetical protein